MSNRFRVAIEDGQLVIKRRPLGGWWPAVLDSGFDPDTEAFAARREPRRCCSRSGLQA
jgi:hypothetical protein